MKRGVEDLHVAERQLDYIRFFLEVMRYEIEVSDWGPDFDGKDGNLDRWRWAVLDADRDTKVTLGMYPTEDVVGCDVPFMVGNQPTLSGAWIAGLTWVEGQRKPALSVVV